ncbi:hypothetical protein [Escherichia coli]|uniref:hypothetical protein n=1 Tax=Escherichia coli TaxID=562 RepID=UPI0020412C51|nr:hypothetical protein [Escherichia coli]
MGLAMRDPTLCVEENPARVFWVTHPAGEAAGYTLYLLAQNWSRVVSFFILTVRLKNWARRVDGLIMGSVESDFSKGIPIMIYVLTIRFSG